MYYNWSFFLSFEEKKVVSVGIKTFNRYSQKIVRRLARKRMRVESSIIIQITNKRVIRNRETDSKRVIKIF